MTELFCKNCKAPLDMNAAKDGVIECIYCRSVFTLPKKETDRQALDYLRIGEHESDACDFDKAYTAFSKAAQCDDREPEAYWGMALAQCKVQYVKDLVGNRLQPICHEVTDTPFVQNRNYLRAVSLATPEQKEQYARRGKEIDYIRSEFLRRRNEGRTYDCFLCAKVTEIGAETQKTADCNRANDIYYYLRDKGYKPFFSERDVQMLTGADYEALILYALTVSKCMLVVCSDAEYLQTPWVKNEYTRFLELMRGGEKASDAITVVYANAPVERLPGREGKIQGIHALSMDAMSRIEEFVRTHVRTEIQRVAATEQPATGLGNIVSQAVGSVCTAAQKAVKEVGAALHSVRRKAAGAIKNAVAPQPVSQQQAEQAIDFRLSGMTIVGYRGAGGDIVIPDWVTSIAHDAFAAVENITSVTMPKKLKKFEKSAFGKQRKKIRFCYR